MRQIRNLEAADKATPVPAVALTAFARDEDRVAAFEAGFQSYLTKPIQPEQLLDVLQQLARQLGIQFHVDDALEVHRIEPLLIIDRQSSRSVTRRFQPVIQLASNLVRLRLFA